MNIVTGRNGATIIDDTYNASPGSMQAALEVLRLAPRGSLRVAVLGDMLELGDHAERAHEEIGSLAGKTADILIAVGEYAPRMVQSARRAGLPRRSEEHTSELQSQSNLVCRLLLEKKNSWPTS